MKLYDLVFGCWHRKLSFPISTPRGQRRSTAACETGTYVVCLDCGREFPYDWKEMRILAEDEQTSRRQQHLDVETNKAA